ARGRVFTRADDQRGCSGVAVLGYGFWKEHYAGSAAAIGSLLRISGHSFPVIGVTPPGFFGMDVGDKFDVALPICAEAVLRGKDSALDRRGTWWLKIAGRLKPGVSLEAATARLKVLAPQIYSNSTPADWPANALQSFQQLTFAARPAATGPSDPFERRMHYARPLEILMVIAAIVLLITCANIASLLLARAAARHTEIAVRLSLGATRGRLIRQVLTESLVLSGTGALLGIIFARWASALLVRFVSTGDNKVILDVAIDGRILAFTASVAIFTGLLFGILPALLATRISLAEAMKGGAFHPWDAGSGANGSPAHSGFGLGRWIVALQITLSLVLLVGTGLFVRTFRKLTTLNPGFDPKDVLFVSMNVHNSGIPGGGRAALYSRVLERLKALSGADSVTLSWFAPMSGSEWNEDIQIEGAPAAVGREEEPIVKFNWIAPEYFSTLRTPLLAGRDFDSRDSAASAPVAIVNQSMARRFFLNTNPLGRRFLIQESTTASAKPIQIVGVVADSKYQTLREEILPFAYVPASQIAKLPEDCSFVIRTAANPAAFSAFVRDAIGEVNRSASLNFHTFTGRIDDTLSQERVLATLSGFFGGLALLLTAVGLYGVMAYIVTRRTHEIGIRIALGAPPTAILRLVMRDVAGLLAAGIGAGILGAFWITKLVQKFLYGVTAHDAVSMAGAVAVLAAAAFVASYLPARRAMRVDPMVALRYE
ncbi:MAG: ABC transporter permease, partial [Candidatus Acidiferrales bacterium]